MLGRGRGFTRIKSLGAPSMHSGIPTSGSAGLPTANLLFWYDASDSGSLTLTGSAVTGWADLSGNGHNLAQANASFQPTLVDADQNGLDTISCDANDSMTTASITHGIGTGDFTLLFALRKPTDASGAFQGLLQFGTNNPGINLSTGGQVNKITFYNTSENAFATVLVQSTAYVITLKRTSGQVSCWVNSVADASNPIANATSIGNAVLTLFNTTSGDWFEGSMFELAMYTSALSASDQATAETYLMNKWDI